MLQKLTESWDIGKECSSSQAFWKPRELWVLRCNSLVTVIPYKTMSAFHNLEALRVRHCKSLESVFESPRLRSGIGSESDTFSDVDVVPAAFALRWVYLEHLPRMKHVWDAEDPRWAYLSFEKLYGIRVQNCHSLRYLFPALVARSLCQLHRLKVEDCERMEGVVCWNNEESANAHHNHQFTSTPSPSPPESTNFSLGVYYSLEWPSVEELYLSNCPKLYLSDCPKARIFTSVQQKSSMPRLDRIITNASTLESQQFLDEIYANPTELTLENAENQQSIIPWPLLVERFPQLQSLTVGCVTYETRSFDIAEDLVISDNCHRLTILAPSSALFHNLTKLKLYYCEVSFPYMVTSSTARGLVQLIELSIESCGDLKEIVTYDNESDEDGKIRTKDDDNHIMISFPQLKTLKLKDLRRLRSFSSTSFKFNFPSLVHVEMKELPVMRVLCEGDFITPYKLRITEHLVTGELRTSLYRTRKVSTLQGM